MGSDARPPHHPSRASQPSCRPLCLSHPSRKQHTPLHEPRQVFRTRWVFKASYIRPCLLVLLPSSFPCFLIPLYVYLKGYLLPQPVQYITSFFIITLYKSVNAFLGLSTSNLFTAFIYLSFLTPSLLPLFLLTYPPNEFLPIYLIIISLLLSHLLLWHFSFPFN